VVEEYYKNFIEQSLRIAIPNSFLETKYYIFLIKHPIIYKENILPEMETRSTVLSFEFSKLVRVFQIFSFN
jgi:hypothetical protein